MQGLMSSYPLTLTHLFTRAERLFGGKTMTTLTATGKERTTYAEWADRTRRLAGALDGLGISDDGRVATFAWNTARHLELYFAAPCSGRVLHTLNIRLFPEQVSYIVDHAQDEVIFVDRSLVAALWPLVDGFDSVRHIVVMDDGAGEIPDTPIGPAIHDYDELLAAASPIEFTGPRDENQADDRREFQQHRCFPGTSSPRLSACHDHEHKPHSLRPARRCSCGVGQRLHPGSRGDSRPAGAVLESSRCPGRLGRPS